MNIMIIGGTSGMGLALARHYLALGHTVAIAGRNLSKLPEPELRTQQINLHSYQFDIANRASVEESIHHFVDHGRRKLDLLIVTAGTYFNSRTQPLDENATSALLRTNVSGLNHAFEIASAYMQKQGGGQLVAVSSIAGLMNDYPGASAYSATKRAVLALCDCYRKALSPFSIAVTAIVPGYVDTEKLRQLNNGDASHKPFIMSEARAVAHIVSAIESRQAIRIFPWQMRLIVAFLSLLPLHRLWLKQPPSPQPAQPAAPTSPTYPD